MTGHAIGDGARVSRIAYLNTRYPALSHTFIQQEVEALRASGTDVVTFSIRKPTLAELGPGADDTEWRRTTYVLESPGRIAWSVLRSCLAAPIRAARTVLTAQRLAPPGLASRIRHLAYAVEAIHLARLLRARALTELHVHMGNSGALVALLACVFAPGMRYSLTIHGPSEFLDIVRLSLRQKAESALFVRFISEIGRAIVMGLTTPESWSKFHVVHCGVAVGSAPPPPRGRGTSLRILAIGRLAPVKGFPLLLDALQRLTADGVPCSLRIAGDGPDRRTLEALATQYRVAESVEFLGPLPPRAIQEELRSADALVSSSLLEGIPVVLMEAMAAGVPVVATRVGGVPEMILHGVNGLLVDPGSPSALASAMSELWHDPDAAARRTVAAWERIESQFNSSRTGDAMRRLLDRYHGVD